MGDMIPDGVRELLMPYARELEEAAEQVEMTMDTAMAIAIIVGVVVVKLVQKKPDRSAQEALDAATPPDLRSLKIAGYMLAFYLLCVPLAWLAIAVPQAELPSEDELLSIEPESRQELGVTIQVVVASGSGWPAGVLCAAVVGEELASGCIERSWDGASSTPEEGEALSLAEGLDAGPDGLPLVLFPCAATLNKGHLSVTVGIARIAWACLPADAAEQAAASVVTALRRSLVQRAKGVQAVANAEASSARLAPLTRIVLTLALEDGLASTDVSGWEGNGGAVYEGIASLGAALGLALGGRRTLEDAETAPVLQTESHIVRHVDISGRFAGHNGGDAQVDDEIARRLHLRVEDAVRHLELPSSYTPHAALEERRWSFVAVIPSGSALGWAATNSDAEERSEANTSAVVVPGRGGIVVLPPVTNRDEGGFASGGNRVNPSTVLQIVAQQCRQLLGLPESTVPAAAAGGNDVSVVWRTDVGTDVMTETELSLVCLAREGALVQHRVLAMLRQLLRLAEERDGVLIPPEVAQAAHAAVRSLQNAHDAGDCTTRLGLQLNALRSMNVSALSVATRSPLIVATIQSRGVSRCMYLQRSNSLTHACANLLTRVFAGLLSPFARPSL